MRTTAGAPRAPLPLDGDRNRRTKLDRRLSRWTHRVGVTRCVLDRHPHLDAPNELASRRYVHGKAWSKKTTLTRGASSSPLQGEGQSQPASMAKDCKTRERSQ
jgi:hypothetical protein